MADNPSFQLTTTVRYDPALPTSKAPECYPTPKDSPYYLLSYHRDRLLSAAIDFHWEAVIALLSRTSALEILRQTFDQHIPDPKKPWRLRVLVDKEANITVETTHATGWRNPDLLLSSKKKGAIAFPRRKDPIENVNVGLRDLTVRDGMVVLDQPVPISAFFAPTEPEPKPWTLHVDTQPTTPSLFTRHKTTMREQYDAARARAGIKSYIEQVEVLLYNPAGEVMEGSITTLYFQRRPPYTSKGEVQWVTPSLRCGGHAGVTRRYAVEGAACVKGVIRVDELVNGELVWMSNGLKGFLPAILDLGKK